MVLNMTCRRTQLLAVALIATLVLAGAVSFASPVASCSCGLSGSGASDCCDCGGHTHSAAPAAAALPSKGQDAQSPACSCGSATPDGLEAVIPALPTPNAHDGPNLLSPVEFAATSEPDFTALREGLGRTEVTFPVSILLEAADTGRRAPPAA
jgi:hypothetical protein